MSSVLGSMVSSGIVGSALSSSSSDMSVLFISSPGGVSCDDFCQSSGSGPSYGFSLSKCTRTILGLLFGDI